MNKWKMLAGLMLMMVLTACDEGSVQQDPENNMAAVPNGPDVLNLVSGSELKDIVPLLPQIKQATGVTLNLNFTGTLNAVEQLQSETTLDGAWLSNNHYAMLQPEVKAKIVASERTMLTPVVLGLKESKAKELGWVNNPNLTWADIAQAAKSGKFTFGMTSPSASNTGFSGLLGLASALSGKGDALELKDVDEKALADFFKAQRLTSGSSGWLAETYVADQSKVDGMINYASTFLSLNNSGVLQEQFVLIYPRDGIVTSDYPLMLVNKEKRAAYDKVIAYIQSVAFQQPMADTTLRKSINPDVVSSVSWPKMMVELPFPGKLEVVDGILNGFENNVRMPVDSTFVLDESGSMSGEGMRQLQAAMLGLSGSDASVSGRFARLHNRELLTIIPFSSEVLSQNTFNMGNSETENVNTKQAVANFVNEMGVGGGTAIYDAVQTAYIQAWARRVQNPNRFYSIVLMTDGENMNGMDAEDFKAWYNTLRPDQKGIKIFTVLFDSGNKEELNELATLTGGKLFDSRTVGLPVIFKEIRGYQ